jgi:hypothetical protein
MAAGITAFGSTPEVDQAGGHDPAEHAVAAGLVGYVRCPAGRVLDV